MAEQIRYDHYLHGGDYNPEQWLDRPDILKKISNISKSPYQYRFHGNVFLGSAGAGRGKI